MKMSDVFDLPLEYAGQCYQDQSGECVGGTNYEKETAMVHATNYHDELVEALEAVLINIKIKHGISLDKMVGASTRTVLENAQAILNKAKGLDK